jgi:transcription elongation factor S-II
MRKTFVEIMKEPADPSVTYTNRQIEIAVKFALETEEALNGIYKDKNSYAQKARSLIYNLRDKKNPELKQRIIDQEFTPGDFVTKETKELASENLKKERE